MPQEIEIAGKKVPLRLMRVSKKGVKVEGARVHVKGLGTVFISVYEPKPIPFPPGSTRINPPNTHQQETLEMLVDVLKAMSDRVSALEDSVTRPHEELQHG